MPGNRHMLPWVILAATVLLLAASLSIGLLSRSTAQRELIAGFMVLGMKEASMPPGSISYADALAKENMSVPPSCAAGSLSLLRIGGVEYLYLCSRDSVVISSCGKDGRGFQEAGKHGRVVCVYPGSRAKVYSGVFELEIAVPRGARQGLIEAAGRRDAFYISNIPYVYIGAEFLEGIGNATISYRVVFGLDGVNISFPPSPAYTANTGFHELYSPLLYAWTRDSLERHASLLRPLLALDEERHVRLKYYVEVMVEARGSYAAEIVVGFPGLRMAAPRR